MQIPQLSVRRRVLAVLLIASMLSPAPATWAADGDTATGTAMKTASEAAVTARNDIYDKTYSQVKDRLKPSEMSCLNKILSLQFPSSSSLYEAVMRAIVNAAIQFLTSMVCKVADDSWRTVRDGVNSMQTDVTLPGGAGAVRVGVDVDNSGRFVVGGVNGSGVVGSAVAQRGQAANKDEITQGGGSWLSNGINRVQSWFK